MIIISTQVNRILNRHRRGLIEIPEDDLQVLRDAQKTFGVAARKLTDHQRQVCLRWIERAT
jgi:hypothetical protein